MKAGQLKERFAFDKRNDVADGYGNTVAGWIEQYQCATRRQMLRGGESVIAARMQGVRPMLLTVRSCVAAREITTDWRARDVRTGETFNVRTVSPSEDRSYIDILCESGVSHG